LETKADLGKPRVILERKVTWSATAEGDGGFIAGKAARGARYPIKRDSFEVLALTTSSRK